MTHAEIEYKAATAANARMHSEGRFHWNEIDYRVYVNTWRRLCRKHGFSAA